MAAMAMAATAVAAALLAVVMGGVSWLPVVGAGAMVALVLFLRQSSELYGLEHVVLNAVEPPLWLNMGLWREPSDTFIDAARALADRVAQSTKLNSARVLVDVGYGCGEQDLHWARKYRDLRIVGLTDEASQTAVARARIDQAGLSSRVRLEQGNAADLIGFLGSLDNAPRIIDAVISLDSAYHYSTRYLFLQQALLVLRPGGAIGLADMVIDAPPQHWLAKLLMGAARLGIFVPRDNLITADKYRAQMAEIGFVDIEIEDITDRVFVPLADWLDRQLTLFRPVLRIATRIKYALMARALRAVAAQRLLRFIVVSASRPAARAAAPSRT